MPHVRLLVAVLLVLGALPRTAQADWDLSLFVGRAFPTYDERLVVGLPAAPSVPGLDIQTSGTPEIRAEGGPVLGAALAWELGVLGIEGRLDLTDVDLEISDVRYDFRLNPPLFGVTGGRVAVEAAEFDVERLRLLSLNARLRTPGPLSLVVSGGLSYLPSFQIAGSVPVSFEVDGLGGGVAQPELLLEVAPGESDHRIGVNGGAGLRIGGRVAVFAEARVFYFREYELRVRLDDPQPLVSNLLESVEPVRFRPVIANAVAGLVFGF